MLHGLRMLNLSVPDRLRCLPLASVILISSIVAGSLTGNFTPKVGDWLGNSVDYTLLLLVSLLFFGVRFDTLIQVGNGVKNMYFIAIALLANFILVPLIGYGVASLFLGQQPLLIVGLVIYFMSPCTDWFLSFTRLANGNVALGATLIPINITLQLLLYPVYLQLFTAHTVQINASIISDTLLQWFLLPLLAALIARQLLRFTLKTSWFEYITGKTDNSISWVTAFLVLQIFAGNISVLMEHLTMFVLVLLCVFTFFLLTCFLGLGLSKIFKLQYPEHALLSMTIAARNAPLMLAITVAALPDQPLIYGALVIGMLIEIPHLTILRQLLLKDYRRLTPKHAADITQLA